MRERHARAAPGAPRTVLALAGALAVIALAAGCGSTRRRHAAARAAAPALGAKGTVAQPLKVVAAENFLGSLAAQLGGREVRVRSLFGDPKADPRTYEPPPAAAAAVARAGLVIVVGGRFDPWSRRLLEALPTASRPAVLEAAAVLGAGGGSPELWYSPSAVGKLAAAIVAAYAAAKPTLRPYFEGRLRRFEAANLAPYRHLVSEIANTYAGTPVGSATPLFQPLAAALSLRLLTPQRFAEAVSEGVEPLPAAQREVEEQLRGHRLDLWAYDPQITTPAAARLTRLAGAVGVPVLTLTATLDPPDDTFEQWQVVALEHLKVALREGVARR